MILYHGTASTYLPSIEKYGLVPKPSHNFKVRNRFGQGVPYHRAVYLTTSRETAENFATLRASYLNALPGERLHFAPATFYKALDGPKPIGNAKPIVLEVNVPEDFELREDEQALSLEAFWHPGTIPPSAIVKVDTL